MTHQDDFSKVFEAILEFPDVTVTDVIADDFAYHVHCESIFDEVYCPVSLEKCDQVYRTRTRIIRDLPVSKKRVYLHLSTRQFYNPDTGKYFYEPFSFVESRQQQTIRYQMYLYASCKDSGLRRVVIQEDLCWETVHSIFTKYAERAIKARDNTPPRILGIDEFAIKKGHKDYACVLVDLESCAVLDVLAYRDKVRLIEYFEAKGDAFCQSVEVFSCDMWDGYVAVAKQMFPNVSIVIDRFHFFAHMNKAVDSIRKQLRRKYTDDDNLKGIKWLLLKNPEKLTSEQKDELGIVFKKFPKLKTAYEMKNKLRDIFESDIDRQEAEIQINQWAVDAEKMDNRYIDKFLTTLKNWKESVLNYFNDRVSNGIVEGINNKIKMIKRMAYGF